MAQDCQIVYLFAKKSNSEWKCLVYIFMSIWYTFPHWCVCNKKSLATLALPSFLKDIMYMYQRYVNTAAFLSV
jgi:hypothetical protein